MNIVRQAARRPERLEALDKVAKPGAGAVGRAWCATCTAWEQRRTSGRRCWPTPNWPTGRSARSTPVACRSCCTGTAGTVYALASTCSHMGGPLEEGTISDGCVICPWPGSTFRFADGSIMRGPASTPEPCYHTRIQNGRIEVRAFT